MLPLVFMGCKRFIGIFRILYIGFNHLHILQIVFLQQDEHDKTRNDFFM